MSRVTAYIGLGSNLDRPREQVLRALEELQWLPDTRLAARSSLYRSAPVGYADQPDFVNAVARIETGLAAERLLAELRRIESQRGRQRSFPNAPRTLDLDLLLYGEAEIVSRDLVVPHPRLHERAFVLKPLAELDPQAFVPGRGRAGDLLARCAGQDVEKLLE